MQFCVECGARNTLKATHCQICNTALVLTVSAKPRKKLPKAVKIVFLTVAGILGSLIVIGMIPWSKPVAFSVTATAPNGGVFEGDCKISDSGTKFEANKLTLTELGSPDKVASSAYLSYSLNGESCTADVEASVTPKSDYDVYIGKSLVGQLTRDDIDLGEKTLEAKILVTNDIQGTVVIHDKYVNCQETKQGTDCGIPESARTTANLNKKTCEGKNSMGSIVKNANVEFFGISNHTSTRSKLSGGIPEVNVKTGAATCTFTYSITKVPNDDKGYSVQVGSRTGGKTTNANLESSSYNFDVILK